MVFNLCSFFISYFSLKEDEKTLLKSFFFFFFNFYTVFSCFSVCVSVCACVKYAFSIITVQLPHARADTHKHTQHHTCSHTLYACSGGSYNSRMTSLYPVCIWRSVIKTLKLKLSHLFLCVCHNSIILVEYLNIYS